MPASEIIHRILSQYQFFNYIITGAIFLYGLALTGIYVIHPKNFLMEIFLYYAAGFFISRVASVTAEPLLKKLGYVKYSDYKKYVKAVKKDPIIDDLSQQNNMFKTAMMASFLLLGIMLINAYFKHTIDTAGALLTLIASIVFTMSYKRQSDYINKRVSAVTGRKIIP